MSVETTEPEFSHKVALSEIGGKTVTRSLVADDNQRAALAKRFDLIALDSLSAEVSFHSDDQGILVTGALSAALTQACVASGAPVPAELKESFAVRFIAEPHYDADAEIELATDECDLLFHDGRAIDLGETVAQTLGLAIDPFPRSPNADSLLKAAGIKDETEVGPFAALAALRKEQ